MFNYLVLLAMMEQLGLDWGTEKGLMASMDKPEQLARGLQTFTDFVVKDKIWDPALFDNDREGFGNGKTCDVPHRRLLVLGRAGHLLRASARTSSPSPTRASPDGKDMGGVGYGYCVYVSRLAKDPALVFEWLDTLASQPNEFIKLGYHQPRVTLSNGAAGPGPGPGQAVHPLLRRGLQGRAGQDRRVAVLHQGRAGQDAVWAPSPASSTRAAR